MRSSLWVHTTVLTTVEILYNEVLGTENFFLIYHIYIVISVLINNTKQRKLVHWYQRKQFVISAILL